MMLNRTESHSVNPVQQDSPAEKSSSLSLPLKMPSCHCVYISVCVAVGGWMGGFTRRTSNNNALFPSHLRPWLIINGGHCCMDDDVATCWKCKQRWQRSLERLRWKEISTRSSAGWAAKGGGRWAVGGVVLSFKCFPTPFWRLTNATKM